jgi:sec-independent protein translocase protein TatA
MIGYQDLLILLGIGIFVFGAKKLPELARSLGQSMKEFKKGVAGTTDEESAKPASPVASPALSSRTCVACKAPVEPNWMHCPKCGASVAQEGTVPPQR